MLGAQLRGRQRAGTATLTLAFTLLAAATLPVLTCTAQAATKPTSKPGAQASSELWATVNLCNTPHHPDTIGIRGSMPGDGRRGDTMYMRFLVQSFDTSTHRWNYLGQHADSGFVAVGSASLTRQAGRSFQLKPTATTFTLRGLIEFQWHRNGRTVRSVYLPTTAHHTSLAGAEPTGFSTAACALP
jgi:hypothetical protein